MGVKVGQCSGFQSEQVSHASEPDLTCLVKIPMGPQQTALVKMADERGIP